MSRNNAPAPTGATTALATRETQDLEISTQGGIVLRDVKDLAWFAENIAKSELIPQNFRGKPADVVVAIQWGFEIGVSPMQALSNIAVINGRASLWGDLVPALLLSRPDIIEWIQEDDPADVLATGRATCTIKRRGNPKPVKVTFTREMAQKAGLYQKQTYQQYEADMLSARARSRAARRAAPDVLKGLAIRDQFGPDDEEQHADAAAIAGASPAPVGGIQQPRPRLTAEPIAPDPIKDGEIVDDKKPADDAATAAENADSRADGPTSQTDAPDAPAASQAAPAADTGGAAAAGGSSYTPPIPPAQPTDRCTREVKMSGRTIYTGGISAITLMKLTALIDRFDKSYEPGASMAALSLVFETETPPDWFHLTEEQGKAFAEYLQAN